MKQEIGGIIGLKVRTSLYDDGNERCSTSNYKFQPKYSSQLVVRSTICFPIYKLFDVQRHLISRRTLRTFRNSAMKEWKVVTAPVQAAPSLVLLLPSFNVT